MSTNPMPSLGSHLSPSGVGNPNGNSSFAETHEIHYAPSGSGSGGGANNGPAYNFSTGATVHSMTPTHAQYDNSAYRCLPNR